MPQHRLLYLTQHQMLAYRWQSGRCQQEGDFAAEAAGTDFAAYLRGHAKSLFTIVTNIAEEGFKQETIPYVQGRDRASIVDRKLGQTFVGSPLSVAVSLGHEKTSRRNERLLLAALTSTSLLEPWIGALRGAEARLTGIHSLPLLTDTLIGKLNLPKERCILVTVQDSSVRQSFLDRGRLVFSRVAPLTNSSIGGMAQSIGSEISRLHQYLQTQRMIGRNETLVAHVLLHPKAHSALNPETAPAGIRINLLDLVACARQLGLKKPPEDSRAETLFLHAAAAYPPTMQFATPVLRKEYRLWQIGNGLRAFSVVAFMSCLLYAGKLHLQQQDQNAQIGELSAKTNDRNGRYQAVVATFPPMPMDNDALRQLVDRLQTIQKADRTPDDLLRHLSHALDRAPEVELSDLEWAHAAAATGGPGNAGAAGGGPEADESLAIRGTLFAGRNTNPRQMLDVFDGLVDQLKGNGMYEVAIQKRPFDVASGKSLKSGEAAPSQSARREFELRILRKKPS